MMNLEDLVCRIDLLSDEIVGRTKNGSLRDAYVAEFAKNLSMRSSHALDDLKQFNKKYNIFKAKNFLPWDKQKEHSSEFRQLTKNYGNVGIMLKGIYENMTGLAIALNYLEDKDFNSLEDLTEEELFKRENRLFTVKKLQQEDVKESLREVRNTTTGKNLVNYISDFFYNENRVLYNKHRKAHKDAIKGHIFKKQRIMFENKDVPPYLQDKSGFVDIGHLVEGSVSAYLHNTVEALEAIAGTNISTMHERPKFQNIKTTFEVINNKVYRGLKKFTLAAGITLLLTGTYMTFNNYVDKTEKLTDMLSFQLGKDLSPISGFLQREDQTFMSSKIEYLLGFDNRTFMTEQINHFTGVNKFDSNGTAYLKDYLTKMNKTNNPYCSIDAYLDVIDQINDRLRLVDPYLMGSEMDSLLALDISENPIVRYNELNDESKGKYFPKTIAEIDKRLNSLSVAYQHKLSMDELFIFSMLDGNILTDPGTGLQYYQASILNNKIEDDIIRDLIKAKVITQFVDEDRTVHINQIQKWYENILIDMSTPEKGLYESFERSFEEGIDMICQDMDSKHNGSMMKYFLENHTTYFLDARNNISTDIVNEAEERGYLSEFILNTTNHKPKHSYLSERPFPDLEYRIKPIGIKLNVLVPKTLGKFPLYGMMQHPGLAMIGSSPEYDLPQDMELKNNR